jgi:hypothetical protein
MPYTLVAQTPVVSMMRKVGGLLRKGRASQFSRYLLEGNGIPERDKNARLGVDKLIKYSTFRAFLAPFMKRELRSLGGEVNK